MKKLFASGAAVAALVIASVHAQEPAGRATDQQGSGQARPPSSQTDRTTGTSPSSQAPASTPTATARLSESDRTFVMEAAIGGKSEVELGQLATQKAQDARVKQFGRQMVQDHGMANQELMQLAQRKGVTLPADVDAKHKEIATRLSKLSGQAFDRAYVQEMLSDHREDVTEFRQQSRNAQDADIKAFAAKTLPTLEHHLSMVQQLSSGDTGTAGTGVPRPTGSTGADTPATPAHPETPARPDAPRSTPGPGR
jgi:putative membrane protein